DAVPATETQKGARWSGEVAEGAVALPSRQCRCIAPGVVSREGDRRQPSHGRAGGLIHVGGLAVDQYGAEPRMVHSAPPMQTRGIHNYRNSLPPSPVTPLAKLTAEIAYRHNENCCAKLARR